MSDDAEISHRRNALVKIAFGLGALGCVILGLAVYLFAEPLGLDPSTAEIVAIAFLAAGLIDYLVLRFWDRIATSQQTGADQ